MTQRVSVEDIAEDARRLARYISENTLPPLSLGDKSEKPGIDEVDTTSSMGVVASMIPVDRLSETRRRLLHVVEPRPPSGEYFGVDGSSRRLEAYRLLVGVYSSSLSIVDGAHVAGAYPDTGVYPYIDLGGYPVASIAPGLGAGLSTVATEPLVNPASIASIAGCDPDKSVHCRLLRSLGYGTGYNVSTMLDENRSLLENAALSYTASRLASTLRSSRILVDGPIYMTPGLLVSFTRAARSVSHYETLFKLVYTLSYLYNTMERVDLIEGVGRAGGRVVGVVKRISRSRLLVNAVQGQASREGEGGLILPENDPQLVETIVRGVIHILSSPSHYPLSVAVGPTVTVVDLGAVKKAVEDTLGVGGSLPIQAFSVKITRTGRTLDYLVRSLERRFLVKRSYYLLVPRPGAGYTMYRVEFPQYPVEYPVRVDRSGGVSVETDPAVLRQVVEADLEVLGEIAWLAIEPAHFTAPLPLAVADNVARSVSRSIALIWYNALRGVVSFTYETLIELGGSA